MAEAVNMPRLGLNEDTSVLGEWFVSEGDSVKNGDELFSIETDKSSMTVYSEMSGTVLKRFYEPYDIIPVMTPVCVIGQPGEPVDAIQPAAGGPAADEDGTQSESVPEAAGGKPYASLSASALTSGSPSDVVRRFLSPRARKLAEANGIHTEELLLTGAENRVIEADVIRAMETLPVRADRTPDAPVIAAKEEAVLEHAGSRIEKLPVIRRTIAQNMMHSLESTAQLTSHMIYNASCIQRYRAWLKLSPGDERNITVTDMILFAAAKTLQQFGYMNAHMISDKEIELFDDVNLGCAVDTERGLMVPTVKRAQELSLIELSRELKELTAKCRGGKILPEEMSGATFTVSNLGGLGVTGFTPILNPPQVGILGVGVIDYAVKKTDEGMLYYPSGHLSLTYDHRAVDGAPAARFLQAICRNLEQFDRLV